jgi:hypothetical protein
VLVKIKPITSIDELLKYDNPYLSVYAPLYIDRSDWQKFVGFLKGAVKS